MARLQSKLLSWKTVWPINCPPGGTLPPGTLALITIKGPALRNCRSITMLWHGQSISPPWTWLSGLWAGKAVFEASIMGWRARWLESGDTWRGGVQCPGWLPPGGSTGRAAIGVRARAMPRLFNGLIRKPQWTEKCNNTNQTFRWVGGPNNYETVMFVWIPTQLNNNIKTITFDMCALSRFCTVLRFRKYHLIWVRCHKKDWPAKVVAFLSSNPITVW